jgi:hypothetical protein
MKTEKRGKKIKVEKKGKQNRKTTSAELGTVSVGSHSWIAAGEEPGTHQFYVTICLMG